MFNILIVDDEMFVRKGIISCINWLECEMNTPFEAANGEEALAVIDNNHIDIIFTDIKMPVMDGIELIKKVRDRQETIEIVVLSCYNDFEYARKALQMGVCDYLFKPTMLPQDIINTLNKTRQKINERIEAENAITHLKEKIVDNNIELKEKYILNLIDGQCIGNTEFESKAKELNICFTPFNIALMIFKIDNSQELILKLYKGDKYLFKHILQDIVRKRVSSFERCEAVFRNVEEFIVIVSGDKSILSIRDTVNQISSCILKDICQKHELMVSTGVSHISCSLQQLSNAYNEACKAADRRFFKGIGNVIFYDDLTKEQTDFYGKFKSLVEKINNYDILLEDSMLDIISLLKNEDTREIKYIMEIASIVVSNMFKKASSYEGIFQNIYSREHAIYSKIYSSKTMDEIGKLLLNILQTIRKEINRKYGTQISEAISYIDNNFSSNDINLEKVAERVNLSANYLSRLFKEQTGKSFIEYMTEKRLEKARELCITTNLKVYEIAEKVGYSDWRYFTKVYKKHFGSSLFDLKSKNLSQK